MHLNLYLYLYLVVLHKGMNLLRAKSMRLIKQLISVLSAYGGFGNRCTPGKLQVRPLTRKEKKLTAQILSEGDLRRRQGHRQDFFDSQQFCSLINWP